MITCENVLTACRAWYGRYELTDGTNVGAVPVSEVPARLRDAGWRSVAKFNDRYELEALGIKVARGQYVGGARPTGKFVDVVLVPF